MIPARSIAFLTSSSNAIRYPPVVVIRLWPSVRCTLARSAPPTDDIHAEVEPAVERLISIIQGDQRRLVDHVNAAYGLTPEDIELLWPTAPPRMPVG